MKYLNGVLTVIAVCLVFITFAITGIIPSANAKETKYHSVNIPVNPDGSITVKMAKGETMDVNIEEIGGSSFFGSSIPVTAKGTVDVSIEEVRGHNIDYTPLPVIIQR